jgi:short-subunit dehydrogenase
MDRLAVVTGGTKGIGKAVIEKFASAGFSIATCARNRRELEQLKVEIESSYPAVKLWCVEADLSKKEGAKEFCDFVLGLPLKVAVLVNNTGFFIPGSITTEPDGTLEKMIDTNLYSAYHVTRGLVSQMKERKVGHIFNVCSIASIKAYDNGGSYAISKFAMLGFSKCLREELKTFNIRVTAVMPGATKTASWDGVDLPEDRFMKTEDVAETIYASFILSNRTVVEEIIIRPQLGDI